MRIDNEFKNLIPPLQPEEYRQLEENILNEGIRESIITWNGIIIDGHNRFEIAEKHNLIFSTIEKEFADREEVKDWIDKNQLGRRNLTDDQRKIIIGRRYNREKKKAHRPEKRDQSDHVNSERTCERLAGEYRISSPSVRRYAKDAELFEKMEQEKPELAREIWSGGKTLTDIKKEEKVKARQEQIEEIKKKIENDEIEKPSGLFDVLVIDPPWNYGREYDPETSRVANPYPEMNQSDLLNIEIPAKDNCVLFLWTTHAFIWDAKELMDKWAFTYKATLVWDKNKMGMGANVRMQCEFCLLGVKGKPVLQGASERDIIRESRREHSRKPEAFYSMVDRMTVGKKLDYFSRENREGWFCYGAETGKIC